MPQSVCTLRPFRMRILRGTPHTVLAGREYEYDATDDACVEAHALTNRAAIEVAY